MDITLIDNGIEQPAILVKVNTGLYQIELIKAHDGFWFYDPYWKLTNKNLNYLIHEMQYLFEEYEKSENKYLKGSL